MAYDIKYVYNDSEFSVFVFKIVNGQKILVHEEQIMKFRLDELEDSKIFNKLKEDTSASIYKIKNTFSIENIEIDLLISPDKFYFMTQSGIKIFDSSVEINQDDVDRAIKSIKSASDKINGYKVIDFISNEYLINDNPVDSPTGKKAEKLEIKGEVIAIDEKTLYFFKELMANLPVAIKDIKVVDYYLKPKLKENGDLILSLEKTKIRFLIINNQTNQMSNFDFPLGTVGLLEKIYEILINETDEVTAEKIARQIQKNWILQTFPYKYDIINNISVNQNIEIVRGVLYQYFKHIFGEMRKQKIHVGKIKVLSNEIDDKNLTTFLSENFSYQAEQLLDKDNYVSDIMSKKLNYVLKNI